MKFYYVNHIGEKIDFGDYPYLFQSGNLLDYKWKYDSSVNKVKNIRKDASEFTVKIAVMNDISLPLEERKVDFNKNVDRLVEVFETDVLENTDGKIYTDTGYYMSCMIVGSKKSSWNMGLPFMFNDLTIVARNPAWVKEETTIFRASGNTALSDNTGKRNLDYDTDYPMDFASDMTGRNLLNDGFTDVNFEITIYGGCQNPEINIAGHKYGVNCQLDTGEYLKINSVTKKIYKVKINGEIVNQYKLRNRDYYIFKKIPSGKNSVSWNGLFGFDITLIEERSEPKWT